MKRIIAVAAVAGLVLAGCGASSSSKAVAGLGQTTAPPETTSAGQATSEPELDSPALNDRVLSVSDLPAGWSVDSSPDDNEDSPIECTNQSRALLKDKKVSNASFVKGTDVPSYQEALVAAPDRYDQIVEIFGGCGRFEYKYQGSNVKGSLDPMSINPINGAKKLAAWRLSVTVDDVNAEGYIAVATTEDALMYVAYLDVFSADLTEFENLTALALGKAAA